MLRQTKQDNLDLRQRKTRHSLVEALAKLMEERPFQELSVSDICRRAMVHRTTFYAHFTDKQELLRYMLQKMEQECISTCIPEDGGSPRQFFLTAARNALHFFRDRKSLYRACLESGADTEARLLEDAAARQLYLRLSQPDFRRALPGSDPEIAARFYVGAMFSLIRWWLSSDTPVPEERLLENLERFIPNV